MSLFRVRAVPGLLCATTPMVAVDAHTLSVVTPVSVWTVNNLLLGQIMIRSWNGWNCSSCGIIRDNVFLNLISDFNFIPDLHHFMILWSKLHAAWDWLHLSELKLSNARLKVNDIGHLKILHEVLVRVLRSLWLSRLVDFL